MILGAVVDKNDHTSWVRLLHLSSRCLRNPKHGGGLQSLAKAVNRQMREEVDPPPNISHSHMMNHLCSDDPDAQLAAHVLAELEEGFQGGYQFGQLRRHIGPPNEATLKALKGKHPPPHPDSIIPSADQT